MNEETFRNNDIRETQLWVRCHYQWSDKIPVYGEYGGIEGYKEGWIMKVLPNQEFVYNGEENFHVASTFVEKTTPAQHQTTKEQLYRFSTPIEIDGIKYHKENRVIGAMNILKQEL